MVTGRVQLLPFSGDLLEPVLRVLSEALPTDPISRSAFVKKVLLDPNFDPAGAPVAVDAGEPVGFALALVRRVPLEDAPLDADRGYITLLGVRPDARRQGVGRILLEHCERYLRDRGARRCLISPYAPGYFTPGVDMSACASCLEFLARRGYAILSRPVSMHCDLLHFRTPPSVLKKEAELAGGGILVERYQPERLADLMSFLRVHFVGDWQRFARAAIERIEEGETPERIWLALSGREVIGFSHYEGERFGPIGVAPQYRGRGIGCVLLYRTLTAMRQNGYCVAWFLWSDDETARRLYSPAGFVVRRRFAIMGKELAP